ncbi:hypothetical protein [Marinilabilia salmonicolor]|nr:hypothetical protein [Marinilabilia salmonicolor]
MTDQLSEFFSGPNPVNPFKQLGSKITYRIAQLHIQVNHFTVRFGNDLLY